MQSGSCDITSQMRSTQSTVHSGTWDVNMEFLGNKRETNKSKTSILSSFMVAGCLNEAVGVFGSSVFLILTGVSVQWVIRPRHPWARSFPPATTSWSFLVIFCSLPLHLFQRSLRIAPAQKHTENIIRFISTTVTLMKICTHVLLLMTEIGRIFWFWGEITLAGNIVVL